MIAVRPAFWRNDAKRNLVRNQRRRAAYRDDGRPRATTPRRATTNTIQSAFDRTAANRDLMKRPDVVLVGLGPYDWHGWIDADPQTKALMEDYVLVAKDEMTPQKRKTYEGVETWVRKDLMAGK